VFGGFKRGVQVILTMKYADYSVQLAKKGTVLQGMTRGPIEIGEFYGMGMNVEKTGVMRISSNHPQYRQKIKNT